MSDAAPAPAPTPAPTTTEVPAAQWFDKFDSETKGYLSNKGLDRHDAVGAVEKVISFHRNAEKMLGAPHDQLVRLPKDAGDTAAKQAIFSKLGKPANANEYKFDGVTFPNADIEKVLRETAHKYDLTQEQAAGMIRDTLHYDAEKNKAALAERSATKDREMGELRKEWGIGFDSDMNIAKAGAMRAGLTPGQWEGTEPLTAKDMIKAFRAVGLAYGEDKYITSHTTGTRMTPDGAKQRITELKADREWSKRYLAGGANESREFKDLMQIAFGRAS